MHNIKGALRICRIQLKKNLITQRTGMVALLIGIYLYAIVQPVRDMAVETGYGATPIAIVFLSCDAVTQMIIMAGAVVLFANAPFEDESHPYLLVRSGKLAWVAGNSAYIVVMSGIYVGFLLMMSVIPLIPNINWSMSWGKIWGTLAATDARNRYEILFEISNGVKRFYDAGTALLYTLLLEWGCVTFLGGCVYMGNQISSKPCGTWIAACFVFFDITIYNILPMYWLPYSPLSIAMVSNMIRSAWGITMGYSMRIFFGGFVLLSITNYVFEKLISGKRD